MLQHGERQQDEVRHSTEDRCRDDAEITIVIKWSCHCLSVRIIQKFSLNFMPLLWAWKGIGITKSLGLPANIDVRLASERVAHTGYSEYMQQVLDPLLSHLSSATSDLTVSSSKNLSKSSK